MTLPMVILSMKCAEGRRIMQSLEDGLRDPLTVHYGAQDVVGDGVDRRARAHIRKCKVCMEETLTVGR